MPPWSNPLLIEGDDYIPVMAAHWNGQELKLWQGDEDASVILDKEQVYWIVDYIEEHFDWSEDTEDERLSGDSSECGPGESDD